jgi:hypothetical protein
MLVNARSVLLRLKFRRHSCAGLFLGVCPEEGAHCLGGGEFASGAEAHDA